jgi:hypothetical protein
MMMEENERSFSPNFSVFEGDAVNRMFERMGLDGRSADDLIGRILALITITWVPMAIFALLTPLPPHAVLAEDFFFDFAAYAQFFAGIPLFIVAERIMARNMLQAARDFESSGVIADADKPRLAAIERSLQRARHKPMPEAICFVIAFLLSLMTIGPELVIHTDGMKVMHSWHVSQTPDGPHLTVAGAWEMLVALPIQIFWWVRWIWKIALWTWYLSRVARFHLVLAASHPDHTGGLGFMSQVQARFAIVILAFGISNIVSTVGYKVAIEHAPIYLPPVWGPVVGFAIGAPLFFLAPLLLFTKQLYRTKKRALMQFRDKAMASALKVERQWLSTPTDDETDAAVAKEMSQLNLLSGFYDRIAGMRVVPFDLRSSTQLIGSAVGPLLPLLPYFLHLSEPWQKVLEAAKGWVH